MNIGQALGYGEYKLKEKNINNPLFEAELLLSFILKKEREYLFAYPEKKLTAANLAKFKKIIAQRIKNIPIAYLLGYKYFYGLKFFVNKDVLIPRPETEMIVEFITHNLQPAIHNLTFIDIGTGSGCIIILIIKELEIQSKFKIQNLKFIGTDISRGALRVAKKNAKEYNVDSKIKFFHGNLLDPILKSKIINHKSNLIITANLPYLTPNQIKNSFSIQKEPRLALVAGNDGLKYYRELFKQLCVNKLSATVLIEIDETQKSKISKLIKQEFPQASFQIKKDLAGLFRLVIINIPPHTPA